MLGVSPRLVVERVEHMGVLVLDELPLDLECGGVWSSDDFALTEAQMTGSQRFVTGPWRYERLDGVDHWVPVHASKRLSELLVDFLG